MFHTKLSVRGCFCYQFFFVISLSKRLRNKIEHKESVRNSCFLNKSFEIVFHAKIYMRKRMKTIFNDLSAQQAARMERLNFGKTLELSFELTRLSGSNCSRERPRLPEPRSSREQRLCDKWEICQKIYKIKFMMLVWQGKPKMYYSKLCMDKKRGLQFGIGLSAVVLIMLELSPNLSDVCKYIPSSGD